MVDYGPLTKCALDEITTEKIAGFIAKRREADLAVASINRRLEVLRRIPEECFRLRWEHVRDGAVHVPFGKTDNARRTIPLTQRTAAILEMRRTAADTEWIFPAPDPQRAH